MTDVSLSGLGKSLTSQASPSVEAEVEAEEEEEAEEDKEIKERHGRRI